MSCPNVISTSGMMRLPQFGYTTDAFSTGSRPATQSMTSARMMKPTWQMTLASSASRKPCMTSCVICTWNAEMIMHGEMTYSEAMDRPRL